MNQTELKALVAELREHVVTCRGYEQELSADICEDAASALEAMGVELADANEMLADTNKALCEEVDETERLRLQVEALRKDAERYRWLRLRRSPFPDPNTHWEETLDAHIDAALSSTDKP